MLYPPSPFYPPPHLRPFQQVSPPSVRGRFGSLNQLSICIGILAALLAGLPLAHNPQWYVLLPSLRPWIQSSFPPHNPLTRTLGPFVIFGSPEFAGPSRVLQNHRLRLTAAWEMNDQHLTACARWALTILPYVLHTAPFLPPCSSNFGNFCLSSG